MEHAAGGDRRWNGHRDKRVGPAAFPVNRWFETGSWLGSEFQGRGLGTEMRAATLHFGFLGLDALMAGTGAFSDNAPSLGVTHKLGYEPNGIAHHTRLGELGETHNYRMSREHFLDSVRRDDIDITGDKGTRELLGLTR
jgi:RimJ/RimL family protein N-acetyltransferase